MERQNKAVASNNSAKNRRTAAVRRKNETGQSHISGFNHPSILSVDKMWGDYAVLHQSTYLAIDHRREFIQACSMSWRANRKTKRTSGRDDYSGVVKHHLPIRRRNDDLLAYPCRIRLQPTRFHRTDIEHTAIHKTLISVNIFRAMPLKAVSCHICGVHSWVYSNNRRIIISDGKTRRCNACFIIINIVIL